MSTVLPELERLLDEAAARHYRRRPPWAVRWALAAGAVAAVVLLVAIVGLRTNGESDERPATPRPVTSADDGLGNAYAILAEDGPAPDPALWREFQLGLAFEDKSSSIWRLARRDGSRRIVVASGINEAADKRLVCAFIGNREEVSASCQPAATLLASDRPWVLEIGTGPIVLVDNDITRIWLRLADGSERELTPRNNLAIGAGYDACVIRWIRADRSRGHAPVDGASRERCG